MAEIGTDGEGGKSVDREGIQMCHSLFAFHLDIQEQQEVDCTSSWGAMKMYQISFSPLYLQRCIDVCVVGAMFP